MDHNLDLLKSGLHKQTQLFLSDLLEKKHISYHNEAYSYLSDYSHSNRQCFHEQKSS